MKKTAFLTLVFCAVFSLLAQEKPDSSVHGLYAWGKLPNGIEKIKIKNFNNPEYKKNFWAAQKTLHESGKRKFMILEIMFEKNATKSRLPKIEDVESELELFLGGEDGIKSCPGAVYAIVPSEEHTSKDFAVLNRIYDYVKKNWNVPVFQWLSQPLEPVHSLKADGWIFDAYSLKDADFYRYCQKYILTGKPIFPILWAAEPGMDGFFKSGWESVKKNAETKIDYCKDLNLPIFLFGVCRKHGSVNCWMSAKPPFPEMREFFKNKLNAPAEKVNISLPVNEFVITGNGTYLWKLDFSKFNMVDTVKLENLRNMEITADGLKIKENAGLEWKFNSADKLDSAEIALALSGNAVEAAYSFDNMAWQSTKIADGGKFSVKLTGKQTFYIRIKAAGTLLKSMSMTVKGTPGAKQLFLTPDNSGKYQFQEKLRQNRFIETVESPEGNAMLLISKGSIALPGKKGGANVWNGTQKVVFGKNPVKKIKVTVNGYADRRNWSCHLEAGISVDGKNPVMVKSNPAKPGQKLALELDVPESTGQCFLHFGLRNSSGVYRANVAPAKLFGYQLEAE